MATSESRAKGEFEDVLRYLPEEVRGCLSLLEDPPHASLHPQEQLVKLNSLQPKIYLSIKHAIDLQRLLEERHRALKGSLNPSDAKDFTETLSNGIAELDRVRLALNALLAKSYDVASGLVKNHLTVDQYQQVLERTAS
ncbi:MAG: hypothetical protein Q9176_003928 [Flavoplaca citrina]